MRRTSWLVSSLIVASACSADLTAGSPDPSVASHDVTLTATVHGSTTPDSVIITVTNTGTRTAFLPRCGSAPLMLTQRFDSGQWTGGVQNFMCPTPSSPGPILVGPGEHIDLLRSMDAGRWRMFISVASTAEFQDASPAYSNAFDVP